jgi:hypothetical protein
MARPPNRAEATMSTQNGATHSGTVRFQENCRRLLATLGLASLSLAGLSARAEAQGSDLSLAVRFGTLGIGGEISKLLTSHVGVRASGNYFSYNKSFNNSDNTYNASLKFEAITGLIDLYPASRGAFHFSAGVMTRPITLTGGGVPNNGTFTINQHTYTPTQVGTLTETAQWGSALPYLGLGFGTPAARSSGLGFLFDLGVAIGKPTVSLTATGASSNAQLQSDLNAQIAKQESDANKIPVYPVVSLGVAYRF